MQDKTLLCVDCFEHLQQLLVQDQPFFYCGNGKCRRFGVLTIGGLEECKCEKRIALPKREKRNA
ncbi:MAG TPA: hypothetical protein VK445_05330 [Dissulfurispiraceae bacterium]|nr:hypothetical protein [Dissulfurispiraceae bacterium]